MATVAEEVNVLVVDDDIMICKTLTRLLTRSGFPARCIDNGQAAIDYLASCQPEVVFLDVMMPDVDGFDVLRNIRAAAKCSNVVVIMYSALSDAQTIRQAMEMGADHYIVKGTLSFEQIHSLVQDFMDKRHH